jgi:hypothetical protein
MSHPALAIILGVFWFGSVALIESNAAGLRTRLVPDYDRFLERLPPPMRFVWRFVLLTGGIFLVESALGNGVAFIESPVGQIIGALWSAAGILVIVIWLAERFHRR